VSRYDNSDNDIPRFEPWLGVMVSSLLPAMVALFLPSQIAVLFIGATVGLFVAGLVMLRRQTLRRRLEHAHPPPVHQPVSRALDPDPLETEAS
jgi:hypothetical protein